MNKHKCYYFEQVPPLHKQLRSLPTGSSDYLKKYLYIAKQIWQYEELVNTTFILWHASNSLYLGDFCTHDIFIHERPPKWVCSQVNNLACFM